VSSPIQQQQHEGFIISPVFILRQCSKLTGSALRVAQRQSTAEGNLCCHRRWKRGEHAADPLPKPAKYITRNRYTTNSTLPSTQPQLLQI